MENDQLSAAVLQLQDRLTDDDRHRLQSFLGDDIPRRFREDSSLSDTLNQIKSLFDQDKISEEDFLFLIDAFEKIQCNDAANLLREYKKRLQSNQFSQSLPSIMPVSMDQLPQDQNEDKSTAQSPLIDDKNTIIVRDDAIINPPSDRDNKQTISSPQSKQKRLLTTLPMTQKCLILFILLSIILMGVLIGFVIWINRLKYELKTKDMIYSNKQTTNKTSDHLEVINVRLKKTGWIRVWEDNFDWNGEVDLNKWDFDIGGDGWGNHEKQYYTNHRKKNARCELFSNSSNGRLIIEARKEDYEGSRFTSARLKSKARWTYGRLQTRVKLPIGRGLWPAIWLLPANQTYSSAYWPDNGEIDLVEQVGYDPYRIHSTVHTKANNHMLKNHPSHSILVNDAVSKFKIYTLDWNIDKIEMFVGDKVNSLHKRIFIWNKHGDWTTWPFDKPFFLLLNIAVGGSWGGAKGIDENIFPGRMEIDWVTLLSTTLNSQK